MFVSTLAHFLGVSSNALLQVGHDLNLGWNTAYSTVTHAQVKNIMKSMRYFLVEGKALPKGRPRVAMRGKFPHVYTPPTTKKWEDHVRSSLQEDIEHMRSQGEEFSMIEEGPIKVRLIFYFKKMPKSDVDNLAKSVLDAANGVLYKDDSQIVDLAVKKLVTDQSEPSFTIGIGLAD